MAKNTDRSARASALRSGWTVESGESEAEVPEAGTEEGPLHLDELDGLDERSGVADEREDATEGTEEAPRAQLGNLAVVLLGLTGGLFMVYAWIWLSWAQYYAGVNSAAAAGSGSIGGVLQQIVFWIAPLAPVLWFLAALLLQRRNPRRLALLIAIGLIVLLPLPAILSSGAAL